VQANNQTSASNGSKLIHWLNQKAFENGMSKMQLSNFLVVSNGYLSQLQNGSEKMISNVGDDFIDSACVFLQASKLSVLIAAEKINENDFYKLNESEYAEEIEAAIHFILKDKNIGAIVPALILNADVKIKEMSVRFFEALTGKILINKK
jgi:hypothetical protein